MKKGLWIGAAVVGLVAASYPGLAWISGKAIEARIGDYRGRMLEQMPYLTVAERIYQRGIFHSREEVTYEFGRHALDAVAAARPDAQNLAGMSKNLRFTIRSDIEHGPFPGFGRPALALIESEFVTDAATQRELARAFGDRKPIEFVTRVGFDGGGVMTVASPAFANLDVGKSEKLSWSGLTMSVEFGRDLGWFRMRGAAPGLSLDSPNGEAVKLAGLSFDSDTQLAFGDLYVGGGAIRVKSARIGVPAQETVASKPPAPSAAARTVLDDLVYSASFDRQGEFLDLTGKLTAARLETGAFKLQDAHYEITFRHLHGPSVAGFVKLMRRSFAEGPPPAAGDPTFETEVRRLGIEILRNDPELVIDQVSFVLPEGDARMSGSARIVGFQSSDLEGAAGVASLAQKIEAKLDISVAESLLAQQPVAGGASPPVLAMIEQQLANLEAQGYVSRAGSRLVTRVEFRNGQLSFNGKPFAPPRPPPPAPPGKPPRDTTHT